MYNLSNRRKASSDAILVSHLELSAGGGRQKDRREGVACVSRSLLLARKHLAEQNVVADDYTNDDPCLETPLREKKTFLLIIVTVLT